MLPRYRIEIVRSAVKEIRALGSQAGRHRVLRCIEGLATDPRPSGCRKLVGTDAWRVRTGPFRIIYMIEDAAVTILVIKVAPRKDAYR